jgi:hypothetical protein
MTLRHVTKLALKFAVHPPNATHFFHNFYMNPPDQVGSCALVSPSLSLCAWGNPKPQTSRLAVTILSDTTESLLSPRLFYLLSPICYPLSFSGPLYTFR